MMLYMIITNCMIHCPALTQPHILVTILEISLSHCESKQIYYQYTGCLPPKVTKENDVILQWKMINWIWKKGCKALEKRFYLVLIGFFPSSFLPLLSMNFKKHSFWKMHFCNFCIIKAVEPFTWNSTSFQNELS